MGIPLRPWGGCSKLIVLTVEHFYNRTKPLPVQLIPTATCLLHGPPYDKSLHLLFRIPLNTGILWCHPPWAYSRMKRPNPLSSFHLGEVVQHIGHLHDSHLDPPKSVHAFFELWRPEFGTVLQVCPDSRWVEWDDYTSKSASNPTMDASQEVICFCCYRTALLTQFVDPSGPFQHI